MPADDLRARIFDEIQFGMYGPKGVPVEEIPLVENATNAVLAELATDPGDAREQLAKALRGAYPSTDTRPSYRAADAVLPILQQHSAHLAAELDRLHTWAGLLELLDEHWPEDIFPTTLDSDDRDPGPRVVSLLRWVERKQAEIERQERLLDEMSQHVDRLERALRDRTTQLATANAKAEHAEEELASVRDHNTQWQAAEAQVAALQRELAEARTVMGLVRLEADKLAGVPGGGTVRKVLADRLHAILPSRPDDPTEIRRLAQATESSEEKADE